MMMMMKDTKATAAAAAEENDGYDNDDETTSLLPVSSRRRSMCRISDVGDDDDDDGNSSSSSNDNNNNNISSNNYNIIPMIRRRLLGRGRFMFLLLFYCACAGCCILLIRSLLAANSNWNWPSSLSLLSSSASSSSAEYVLLFPDDNELQKRETHNAIRKKKNPTMTAEGLQTKKTDESTTKKSYYDDALNAARRTGIEIITTTLSDNATNANANANANNVPTTVYWGGPYGGNIKPVGPLAGKRIGIVVASDYSDFQAYYLVSYIGEYGGISEFLLVDWITWKYTRPNIRSKGVRGMWDLSVDPIPVMGGSNKAANYKNLRHADPKDYDALVIVGGHSPDIMITEQEVLDFIRGAANDGAVLGSIGEGALLLIGAGVIHGGQNCTGNRAVDYMLKKIANYQSDPPSGVVTDGKLITARDTTDTPAFLQELCKLFDSSYKDYWKDSLVGKKAMILVAGDDYEDIELVVPTMELLYRGAEVLIGTIQSEKVYQSRSPHLDSNYLVGNFGTTIPFQEIPSSYYNIKQIDDINISDDFDVLVIPGGFNPQNIVASGKADWLKKVVYDAGKLIAVLCHGPIPLAAADIVRDVQVTGFDAARLSVDIMGGVFLPQYAAIIDGQIISGRTPPEIPEFMDAITVALLRTSSLTQHHYSD